MEEIKEAVDKVIAKLDLKLQYTESNLQRCLHHFLAKTGDVQSEVTVPYFIFDEGTEVYCGAGRIDLCYTPKNRVNNQRTKYILELKRSDRHYNQEQFWPQVRKYLKHYKSICPVVGVLIVFCPINTICVVVE